MDIPMWDILNPKLECMLSITHAEVCAPTKYVQAKTNPNTKKTFSWKIELRLIIIKVTS